MNCKNYIEEKIGNKEYLNIFNQEKIFLSTILINMYPKNLILVESHTLKITKIITKIILINQIS